MCLKKTDLHPLRNNIASAMGADSASLIPMAASASPGVLAATGGLVAQSTVDEDKHVPDRWRRLWELPAANHCPLIGVCFGREEIRQILSRHVGVSGHEDYELHVLAVSECTNRSDISRAFMKVLEKRFAKAIRRYDQARNADEIEALWRDDVVSGNAAGALWASLSHPACSKLLNSKIYGDIHLLQHEAAAQARVGIRLEVSEKQELVAAERTRRFNEASA